MQVAEFERAVAGLPLQKAAFFDSIGSTNDIVVEWAHQGIQPPALAAADEQTRGRGRAGRSWQTPRNSALALSLLLSVPEDFEASQLGRVSGLGALAVCEALETSLALEPQIKWPNDVLLEGQKVCGVLAEAHWEGSRLQALVLGIGINLASQAVPPAEELRFPATSLEEALGYPADGGSLLRKIVESSLAWQSRMGESHFLQAWERRLAYRGQIVRLENGDGTAATGWLEGLTGDGLLKLKLPSGELQEYPIGEIALRPAE